MAQRAKTVYRADISYGRPAYRRGHWSDRLPAMDTDIAAVRAALDAAQGAAQDASKVIAAVTSPIRRPAIACEHAAPGVFHPGRELALSLTAKQADKAVTAILHYRHVDQAERWQSLAMTRTGDRCDAAIPAAYTASAFPLQYYFEFQRGGTAWLYPAFNATLSNQPYYAMYRRA
jgi:hypothetical protein